MARYDVEEECSVAFQVCTNGKAIRGYPTGSPGYAKKLPSTTEVISLVAIGTTNEAFGRVMGKCHLGLLLL